MSSHLPLISKGTSLLIPLDPDLPSQGGISSLASCNSFSSTSSINSSPSEDDSHILIRNKSRSLSSIPFSWEKLPGIPKRQLSRNFQEPSPNFLPLPPSTGTPTSSKKLNPNRSFRKDPFFAALVECSKEDADDKVCDFWRGSAKITRSLSDRIGFVSMYASCKSSCATSESVIYVPKPRKHYIFNGSLVKFK